MNYKKKFHFGATRFKIWAEFSVFRGPNFSFPRGPHFVASPRPCPRGGTPSLPDLLDDERLGQAGRARATGGAAARTAVVAGQRVAASAAPGRPHAVRHGRLDGYDGGPGGLSAPEAPAQVLGVGDGRGAAAVQQRAFDERRGVAQRPGLARRQPADAAVGQRERRRPFVEPEVAVRRRHGVHLLGLPPRFAVPANATRVSGFDVIGRGDRGADTGGRAATAVTGSTGALGGGCVNDTTPMPHRRPTTARRDA